MDNPERVSVIIYLSTEARARLDDLAKYHLRSTSSQALVFIEEGLSFGMPIRMKSNVPGEPDYILGLAPGDAPSGNKSLSVYMPPVVKQRIIEFQHNNGISRISQAARALIEVGIYRAAERNRGGR